MDGRAACVMLWHDQIRDRWARQNPRLSYCCRHARQRVIAHGWAAAAFEDGRQSEGTARPPSSTRQPTRMGPQPKASRAALGYSHDEDGTKVAKEALDRAGQALLATAGHTLPAPSLWRSSNEACVRGRPGARQGRQGWLIDRASNFLLVQQQQAVHVGVASQAPHKAHQAGSVTTGAAPSRWYSSDRQSMSA